MSSPADLMTQMLLAQITDLQRRVTNQEAIITTLKQEFEAFSNRKVHNPTLNGGDMQHGVARGYRDDNREHREHREHRDNRDNNRDNNKYNKNKSSVGPVYNATLNNSIPLTGANNTPLARKRPQVASTHQQQSSDNTSETRLPPVSLSALLKDGEEVTLEIGMSRENGTYATCVTNFVGGELCVKKCDLVSSMVGQKSEKPGNLLYKFMTELHNGGHIQRMFKIAPWKLCSVVRDGKKMNLEELKSDS